MNRNAESLDTPLAGYEPEDDITIGTKGELVMTERDKSEETEVKIEKSKAESEERVEREKTEEER